jgi:hypothetical protein
MGSQNGIHVESGIGGFIVDGARELNALLGQACKLLLDGAQGGRRR